MSVSRQVRAAVTQSLTALTVPAARTLLYKHFGAQLDRADTSSAEYLCVVAEASDEDVLAIANEFVVHQQAVRADAPTKHVFDSRVGDLERWLLHDGWVADSGAIVRVTPAAEDVTGIRDKLAEDVVASGLDGDGAILRALEDAATAFTAAIPDLNGSITHVRIALETTARRVATTVATRRALAYPQDSWGRALQFLRASAVLEPDEEEMLARVYTFISPGAHVPKGITDEEWARLARTFGISSVYFLMRKYNAST
ncbi:MAG: hypothetical protein WAU45_17085 [Blastocatellia bacterium]